MHGFIKWTVYDIEVGQRKHGEVIEKDCPTCRYSRKMLRMVGNGEKVKLKCCIIVRKSVYVNECFFWYQLTPVIMDKGPLIAWILLCINSVFFLSNLYHTSRKL